MDLIVSATPQALRDYAPPTNLGERVLGEDDQKTRLAARTVADNNKLLANCTARHDGSAQRKTKVRAEIFS